MHHPLKYFSIFLGCDGSSLMHWFILLAAKWELCAGFPLCGGVSQNTDSRHAGFSTCSMWVQKLGCRGLLTPWHVESLQTRDWTHVPCIGRWIRNHWATREVPPKYFKSPLIQWICYLNGCQCVATSSYAFWNFLEFFFFWTFSTHG